MKLRKPQAIMHIAEGSSVIRWYRYVPTTHGVEQYITNGDGDYQLRAQIEDQHWAAFCEGDASAAKAQRQDDEEAAAAIGAQA